MGEAVNTIPSILNKCLFVSPDRQTDTLPKAGEITLKRSCNVLKFNPSEKKHAVPIETLIAVPGSTVTYSRLNRKYNICAFTQEIQVFEG